MAAEYRSLDPFASPAFRALQEYVLEARESVAGGNVSFEDFEMGLLERLMALGADLTAQHLARYDVEAEEVMFQGEPFRFKMKWKEEYCGIGGKFPVERSIYVPRSREGKAICPLEIRAGMGAHPVFPLYIRTYDA